MKKLDIIYEDKNLLVVNKPAHLLTISDGKTTNTLYSMAREYVKKQHKSNKIFIVHRLDKDTSGLVLFAKNEELKHYLQNNWHDITTRIYLGITQGKITPETGTIKEYLKETKTHQVYASSKKDGAYAETHYEVLNYTSHHSTLKITIITGKKNQIRVGFSNLHHPLIGDKKYGSTTNPIHRLGLHAWFLKLNLKGKNYEFIAPIPREFTRFCNF